jgi:hypothetical protein
MLRLDDMAVLCSLEVGGWRLEVGVWMLKD